MGFGQQIIPSSRAKDEEKKSVIFAEERAVWTVQGRDQRANTISSALLSHLFGLIDRHTKPKPPWKNWPISTHAE